MTDLHAVLKKLPGRPGVYLFKDRRGEVLYVGKAKNLRNRVRSYFTRHKEDRGPRIEIMISQIADLDYIVVNSELESLILENNLIKQYQPRFNVALRDDKNYAFIKIDYGFEIPQVYAVRKIESERKPQARYFGPYTGAVKPTLKLIFNLFYLCRNKKITDKPCFAYQLGRCLGVCFGKISLTEYRKTLRQVEDFLKASQKELLNNLQTEMKLAAAKRKFEKAGILRDKLQALTRLWEKQKIISPRKEDQDYLGLFSTSQDAVVTLFSVRDGRLIHTEHFELTHQDSFPAEILERFLLQYYADATDLPREVIISEKLNAPLLILSALQKIAKRRIKITRPLRGKKSNLQKLAAENARLYHDRQISEFQKADSRQILEDLAKFLHLPKAPVRIEGYDISNIQGTNSAGSMVVFTNGQPDKSQYRKFKIKFPERPNDFAMMREMLSRRFKRLTLQPSPPAGEGAPVLRRGEGDERRFKRLSSDSESWPAPDLIIIDGGKGQLNIAVKVLHDYNIKIPAVGLAKRLEEIFLPGQKVSRLLPPDNPVLFLLQRIRDEAHRFAITFYRLRHLRAQTRSRLQDISGVGPVNQKKLLKRFGSAAALRESSLETIASEVGLKMAKKIKEQL